MDDPGVKDAIDSYLGKELDFGVAYGQLRQIWALQGVAGELPDVAAAWKAVHDDKKAIEQSRIDVYSKDIFGRRTLHDPYRLGPRRIWDLYSHRVVELYFVPNRDRIWAITHSWREKMEGVLSAVNEREWPVPLPPGVTLEAVREELLGMGSEYCWLDVVCARQRASEHESEKGKLRKLLRDKEMEVDIPTMGNIYVMAAMVVRYYNGLGCPFTGHGLSDSRHWLKRVWTLQEMNLHTRIGGLSPTQINVPVTGFEYDHATGPYQHLSYLLRPLEIMITITPSLVGVVKGMRDRHASDPVDKIYGLGYLLKARSLPAYTPISPIKLSESSKSSGLEDVWSRLVRCMADAMHGELLFLFTQPGNGEGKKWLPTWKQLMEIDMINDPKLDETVVLQSDGNAKYEGYRFQTCEIAGTEVTVMGRKLQDRKFSFLPSKSSPPPGIYTLVANPRRDYFVVCKHTSSETAILDKVSVIRLRPNEPGMAKSTVWGWGLVRSECIFR